MSRELIDEHLKAAHCLAEKALAADDPDVVLGLIHRAETRLRNARINAAIEAEARDAASEEKRA